MQSMQVLDEHVMGIRAARVQLETPIDGVVLFETVITDLHWSSLQIGMFTCLLSACSKSSANWTLRTRRHLLQDNALIVLLGLRYFEDIGIDHDVVLSIENTYEQFAAFKKRLDPRIFNSESYSPSQRHALQANAVEWRTLVQTALAALTISLPLVGERLSDVYVSNHRILMDFLNEVLEGRTNRVNDFGEMQLPTLTQRRLTPRHTIVQSCSVEFQGRVLPATLSNVSRGGLGIDCKCDFAPGDQVVVVLRQGRRLSAQVVWQKGQNTGLKLAQPLELTDPLFQKVDG